jgi:hypothetical protein
MGSFRFYCRVHIFPSLSVNFSKSRSSLSVGVRGAHVTVGRRGVTRTVGIPGTGVYYTSRSGHQTGVHHVPGQDGRGDPAAVGVAGWGGAGVDRRCWGVESGWTVGEIVGTLNKSP